MLKTFFVGVVLGILAVAGVLYAVPAVDHYRESSIVSVAPNGGTSESFHINVPMDRIMTGAQDQVSPLPEGLEWPQDTVLNDVGIELFKIRNAQDVVVGVASRTAASSDDQAVIDWLIHLPARGSMFFNVAPEPLENGYRGATLKAGSREFQALTGTLTERWVADRSEDSVEHAGRIELQATYVGELEPLE